MVLKILFISDVKNNNFPKAITLDGKNHLISFPSHYLIKLVTQFFSIITNKFDMFLNQNVKI